jgi:hypothetical protein
MRYDRAILAALANSPQPGHRDLVNALDPENKDHTAFNAIGLALTRMYRAGLLTREEAYADGRWRLVYKAREV